jgi:glycosyltransferase involved in cell wall biosynthesis
LPPRRDDGWSHLGADFRAEAGTPTNAEQAALAQLEDHSFALVVGSIEPHKAHRQTLAAFEQLWAQGNELRLVVFGKRLWLMDEFVGLLRAHEENGHRLCWFEGGSDALLEAMLQRADFLLMPSEDEGFGLPIVEAARRGVPLLLRDIPVFREIAGPHARYFAGMDALELARELGGERRSSAGMTTLTWAQAADNFWHLIEQVDASRP